MEVFVLEKEEYVQSADREDGYATNESIGVYKTLEEAIKVARSGHKLKGYHYQDNPVWYGCSQNGDADIAFSVRKFTI